MVGLVCEVIRGLGQWRLGGYIHAGYLHVKADHVGSRLMQGRILR